MLDKNGNRISAMDVLLYGDKVLQPTSCLFDNDIMEYQVEGQAMIIYVANKVYENDAVHSKEVVIVNRDEHPEWYI